MHVMPTEPDPATVASFRACEMVTVTVLMRG